MDAHTHRCAYCGDTFRSARTDARTCSDRCRVAYYRKQKAARAPVTPAPVTPKQAAPKPLTDAELLRALGQPRPLDALAALVMQARAPQDWQPLAALLIEGHSKHRPKPAPVTPKKARPKVTPEQAQARLAQKFAEASSDKTFSAALGWSGPTGCGTYFRGAERIEIRQAGYDSYIGLCVTDGVRTYRRFNRQQVGKLKQAELSKEALLSLRRRIRELAPDKSGREQTPEEREEYTKLNKQLREASTAQTREKRRH